jgi:hypothetical protein
MSEKENYCKEGLEYFRMETNIFKDHKIRHAIRVIGSKGLLIYFYLLAEIYGDKGYYLKWEDSFMSCILNDIGYEQEMTEELVQKVLKDLIRLKFFDEKKYNDYSILTSYGIQKRYHKAIIRLKRPAINPQYQIIRENVVNDEETNVAKIEKITTKTKKNVTKNENMLQKSGKLQQKKNNLTKVNITKENIITEKEIISKNSVNISSENSIFLEWLEEGRITLSKKLQNLHGLVKALDEYHKTYNAFFRELDPYLYENMIRDLEPMREPVKSVIRSILGDGKKPYKGFFENNDDVNNNKNRWNDDPHPGLLPPSQAIDMRD